MTMDFKPYFKIILFCLMQTIVITSVVFNSLSAMKERLLLTMFPILLSFISLHYFFVSNSKG